MVPTDTTQDPKTCTNWRRVDCPDEIVTLLQERNRVHFGQSRDCSLTSDPFDSTMDFTAACHRADALLEGSFTGNPSMCSNPTDDETERDHTIRELSVIFFDACKFVNAQAEDHIQSSMTLEEYKGKIQVWTNAHLLHPARTCTLVTSRHTGRDTH
jgi:hypothetical protein